MTKAAVKENELDIMVDMINADHQHIARSKAKANMYRYMAEGDKLIRYKPIVRRAVERRPARRKCRVYKDGFVIACVSLMTTVVLALGICIGTYF